jgi:preprotein translocase subunit SecF
MIKLVPAGTNIDFIGRWKIAAIFSLLLTAFAIYTWVSLGERKYGTDFKGGYDYLVELDQGVSTSTIREALDAGGVVDPVVQKFESDKSQFAVRFGAVNGATTSEEVKEKVSGLIRSVSPGKFELLQTNFVGPTIGNELRQNALAATLLGVVFLLIYISFRFEFAFALGAVVAVFHDVVIATGIYLAFGHTMNMGAVAAALTILGYSVNDTIVIFDRVREELRNPKHKDMDLASLFNFCINEMLGRTIITSGLTLFSVVSLLIFGGGSIADLSFFLMVGMICGVYSTIFIASPVVLAYEGWARRRRGQ